MTQHQLHASWYDLSEDELRVRLSQRGYSDPILSYWLDTREDPETVVAISDILGSD